MCVRKRSCSGALSQADGGVMTELATQPCTRLDPITPHGAVGQTQGDRCFAIIEPRKEPTLHHVREPRIDPGEPLQRFVDLEKHCVVVLCDVRSLLQWNWSFTSAAFDREPLTRVRYQHMTHGQGRCPEEMLAVMEFR